MKTIIDKNNYLSHFTGFLFVLMAICDVYRYIPAMILTISILSIVAFIFYFPMEDKNHFSESMLFILFLLITSLVNLFFTDNGFGGTSSLVGNLLLTLIYLRGNNKKMTIWIIVAYALTMLFLCYKLFVLKLTANELYDGLSRNHAGFVVVFWTIFLLFHLKVTYKIYPIILPLICLFMSFFLIGRTSIAVSLVLLFIVFYFKFKGSLAIRVISVSFVIAICSYVWLKFGALLMSETNFSEGLDTPRWELWRIYFDNINFVNFFTGIDVEKLPLYNHHGNNPHNSFIKFHSRIGIGSIVFISLLFVSIYTYLKRGNYYIFWLLLLLTIRACFDSDILVGNFDFIFFIITFYWIKTESYES